MLSYLFCELLWFGCKLGLARLDILIICMYGCDKQIRQYSSLLADSIDCDSGAVYLEVTLLLLSPAIKICPAPSMSLFDFFSSLAWGRYCVEVTSSTIPLTTWGRLCTVCGDLLLFDVSTSLAAFCSYVMDVASCVNFCGQLWLWLLHTERMLWIIEGDKLSTNVLFVHTLHTVMCIAASWSIEHQCIVLATCLSTEWSVPFLCLFPRLYRASRKFPKGCLQPGCKMWAYARRCYHAPIWILWSSVL